MAPKKHHTSDIDLDEAKKFLHLERNRRKYFLFNFPQSTHFSTNCQSWQECLCYLALGFVEKRFTVRASRWGKRRKWRFKMDLKSLSSKTETELGCYWDWYSDSYTSLHSSVTLFPFRQHQIRHQAVDLIRGFRNVANMTSETWKKCIIFIQVWLHSSGKINDMYKTNSFISINFCIRELSN